MTEQSNSNDPLVDHWHQSNGYGVTVTHPGEQLRARVRIDAYAHQSHAVAERFTSVGWVEVVRWTPSSVDRSRLLGGAYDCPTYADPNEAYQRVAVRNVADRLLAEARRVVLGL